MAALVVSVRRIANAIGLAALEETIAD